MERLLEALNPAEHVPICEDKRLFAAFRDQQRLPGPRVLTVLERTTDEHSTARTWSRQLADHGSSRDIVVKPAGGHRGVSVRVLGHADGRLADHAGQPRDPLDVAHQLVNDRWSAYVVEERVESHSALRQLTGHDYLNTLRIVTLSEERRPARIVGCFWRIGVGREPLDSFRTGKTGNLYAGVSSDGRAAMPFGPAPSGFGLEAVPMHPVTGAQLEGYRLPDWNRACALALRAAEALRELPSVGWDVALTDRGPLIIEGNAWWAWLPDPRLGAEPPVISALRDAVARAGAPERAPARRDLSPASP